jgi:hypothetical protein
MRITFQFDDKTEVSVREDALQISNGKIGDQTMVAISYKAGGAVVPVISFPGQYFSAEEMKKFTDDIAKQKSKK